MRTSEEMKFPGYATVYAHCADMVLLVKTSNDFILFVVLVTAAACVPPRRLSSDNMDSYNCDRPAFSRFVLAIVLLERTGNRNGALSARLRRERLRRTSVPFLMRDTGDVVAPNRMFLPKNAGVTFSFLFRSTGVLICGVNLDIAVLRFFGSTSLISSPSPSRRTPFT